MNGYLKIKTRLDNKDIDKDIAELNNKIKKLQEDNAKASVEENSLQQEINNYEELHAKAEEYKNKLEELKLEKEKMLKANKSLVVSQDTPEYANIKAQIAEIENKYAQVNNEIDKQAPKIDKVYQKLDKVKAKQTENNARISEYEEEIESINIDNISRGLDNVGRKIESQISKIGKMVLAVFSIRTAWSAVSRAVNLVKQYNPQIATDFQYMGYVISKVLAPAVQWLTKLIYTLLSYINAISVAWFGINLFSGASVKNFKKMQSSAGSTAKSAKEIQKSLQGFDEMNILSDNTSNASGGGSSVGTPSTDLSDIENVEFPSWLKDIIKHKDEILSTLATIALIIGAIKLGNLIGGIINVSDGIFKLVTWVGNLGTKLLDVFKNLGLIKSIGIVVIIAGVVALIQDIIEMIIDPSWSKFGEILTDIGVILTGIALVTGNWILLIVGLVAVIAGLITSLLTEEGAIMSVEDAQKNLEEATKNLEKANESYIDSVDKAENTLKALKEAEDKAGISGAELNKQVEQGILDYKDMTTEQKQVYKAYLDNEKAQKELEEATKTLTEAKQKEKIASWENKLATMAEAGQYDEYKKSVVEAFKNGELSAEEARDLIGKSMSGMSRDSQQTFMEDLPSDIKEGLDPKNYETTGQKIKKWFGEVWKDLVKGAKQFGKDLVNGIIGYLEGMVNKAIDAVNLIIKGLNKLKITLPDWAGGKSFGVNIGLVPKVSLPRLAKGGIISQPTQAIIGEAGKEAVMPLENNLEWLDILADKLASRIGNNGASYIIQLNGRTLERGIAKQKQELAFAMNGR